MVVDDEYSPLKLIRWTRETLGLFLLTFCCSIILRKCSLPGCWLNPAPRPDNTSFPDGFIIWLSLSYIKLW